MDSEKQMMNGVILFVSKFEECIEFYKAKIQAPILMQKIGIVRFSLGSMYLQIEDAGLFGVPESKGVIIRTNVDSVLRIQRELSLRGVELEVHPTFPGFRGHFLE